MYVSNETTLEEALEPLLSRTVLIVEDDRDGVAHMASILEDEGYVVSTASNGREGLMALTSGSVEPCVLLLDLKMPVMDGWELLAVMRAYVRLSRIPVVLITADAIDRASRPAFDAFLKKPFTAEQLLEVVARVCATPRTPRP